MVESQPSQLAGCPPLGVFSLSLAVAMCRGVREAKVSWELGHFWGSSLLEFEAFLGVLRGKEIGVPFQRAGT